MSTENSVISSFEKSIGFRDVEVKKKQTELSIESACTFFKGNIDKLTRLFPKQELIKADWNLACVVPITEKSYVAIHNSQDGVEIDRGYLRIVNSILFDGDLKSKNNRFIEQIQHRSSFMTSEQLETEYVEKIENGINYLLDYNKLEDKTNVDQSILKIQLQNINLHLDHEKMKLFTKENRMRINDAVTKLPQSNGG